MSDPKAKSTHGGAKLAIFMLVVTFFVTIGWSVFWYMGHEKAKESYQTLLANYHNEGKTITCENAKFGGFPFRHEIRCQTLKIPVNENKAIYEFKDVVVVSMAWNPYHIIAQAKDRLSIHIQKTGKINIIDWHDAQLSLLGDEDGLYRLDLVAHSVRAPEPKLIAERFEFHMRTSAEDNKKVNIYSYASGLKNGKGVNFEDASLFTPENIVNLPTFGLSSSPEIEGFAEKFASDSRPKNLPLPYYIANLNITGLINDDDLLSFNSREEFKNDGSLNVNEILFVLPNQALRIMGDSVSIDNKVNGQFDLSIANTSDIPPALAPLAIFSAPKYLHEGEFDKGVQYTLKIKDNKLFIGDMMLFDLNDEIFK